MKAKNSLSLRAPAKINLVLKILYRRSDGYHELYTIFQKINLADELELALKGTQIQKSPTITLQLSGEIEVPQGEKNLCVKAAQLLAQRLGGLPPVHIFLRKNIPTEAGLGGGSSDAAAVLKGINLLLGEPLRWEELAALAQKIGADVPFFLFPHPTALGRGIGEHLFPWPTHEACYLLVFPKVKVSTRWAYQNLRLTTRHKPPNYEPARPLWSQGLVNDFEPVVFKAYPVLKEIKKGLLACGAVDALLSGSGATVFGVFETEKAAKRAREDMEKRGFRAEVVINYV